MRKLLATAAIILVAGLSINVGQADAAVVFNELGPKTLLGGGSAWYFYATSTASIGNDTPTTISYCFHAEDVTGSNASISVHDAANTFYVINSASIWPVVEGQNCGVVQWSGNTSLNNAVSNGVSYRAYTFEGNGATTITFESGDFLYITDDGSVSPLVGTNTRIVSVDPFDEEVVSTTTSTGGVIYINEADYVDGMYFSMNFTNNTLANGVGGSALDAWNSAFGEIIIPLNVGLNTVSTTTTFLLNGQVNAIWRVKVPNSTPFIGFFLPDQVLLSSSTQFVVGQRTALDIAMASTSEALITALLTGTTTAQSVIRCNPWDFDIMICLISLIIPPQSVLQGDFEQLRDGFLTKWPLGYVTRLIDILAASTTRAMPVISAIIPAGVVGAGSTITLDINNSLDYILNATTSQFNNVSASSTRTLYEITSDYWEIFVYACLGLYILRRILGSHLIGHHKK